jgi:hypothetical protein
MRFACVVLLQARLALQIDCDTLDRALEGNDHAGRAFRGVNMTRLLFVIPFVLLASDACAQQQGHDACARDVSRFCRAYMQQGDQIVLACLKQNRARLSKACDKVLTEHGQ